MRKPGWYLIAYDISEPRRLRRLHRYLRTQGIAMQQSVFLVRRDTREIAPLMDELDQYIDAKHDDLRAYPVTAPGEIWLHGQRAVEGPVLLPGASHATGRRTAQGKKGGKDKKARQPADKRSLWQRLRQGTRGE